MVVHWTFKDYWQGQPKTEAFYFSGGEQAFVIPDGIDQVQVRLRGAPGGGDISEGVASGGYVRGMLPVTPGDTLYIRIGGIGATSIDYHAAAGGYNGGGAGGAGESHHKGGCGGGGATDIRLNGHAISDIVVLAAGGGGNSGGNHLGGCGGPDIGQVAPTYANTSSSFGGQGGSQTTGGAAGEVAYTTSGGVKTYTTAITPVSGRPTAGSTVQGGTGAVNLIRWGSGGGGAGYEGGGGGGNSGTVAAGYQYGGGGGSNYVGGLDDTQGINNQRGIVSTTKSGVPIAMVEIVFTGESDVYTFEVNPNEGGSPEIGKQMTMLQNTGPNRMNIVQEGQTSVPILTFSGVILTQEQYENLEYWFDRRVLIEMVDDLGRTFYGIFSKFSPKRERRPYNPWYHQYSAEFHVTAYINASGQRVYGRML